MTAVHQFVPTLAPRDAVGTHYLGVQSALRDAGYRSDIYAFEAKDHYRRRARPFRSFRGGKVGEPTWLLYHSSVGSVVAEFVAERPEPLIVDYHNITPSSFFARWEPHLTAQLTIGRRQLAHLGDRAELGIGDSAFNASELEELGYARTAVVPILLDPQRFTITPDPAVLDARRARRARGGTDWLFVGRISPNKAQHDLVKGFAAYRRLYDADARLTLVGSPASHAYETTLRGFVDALGLGDAVTLTGGISDAALAAHYDTADVFVVASEHEGFCVPLLEAMAHRLPVVAYAAAAVPETLDGAGLLLDTKDPATIAAAAHRTVTDPDLRNHLTTTGTTRLTDFAPERVRRTLVDAVASAVGEP